LISGIEFERFEELAPGGCPTGRKQTTQMVFSSTLLIKVLGGKPVIARLQRHNPRLNVEIAQKPFPDDLDVAAGYHVWTTRILSGLPSSASPQNSQKE
jgi:hypothetical protein